MENLINPCVIPVTDCRSVPVFHKDCLVLFLEGVLKNITKGQRLWRMLKDIKVTGEVTCLSMHSNLT